MTEKRSLEIRKSYEGLRFLLERDGIGISRLSKDTGISQGSLYDWKIGRSIPKVDKMIRLAKYFKMPLEYFLEGLV